MNAEPLRPKMTLVLLAFSVLFGLTLACARTIQTDDPSIWSISGQSVPTTEATVSAPESQPVGFVPTRLPGAPIASPTPDQPHPLPAVRTEPRQHVVQAGETLGQIARDYGVSLQQIIDANQVANPDILEIGQLLNIPVPTPSAAGPDFKIIPDSELTNGPAAVNFDLYSFIQERGGYLAQYTERLDPVVMTGPQIVDRIATDYSVNPRILLAVLEYQSHWVSQLNPTPATLEYPLGLKDTRRKGLYRQLAWAADNLNRGYYLWRVNGVASWILPDGNVVPISATINAGTAGVQNMFASLLDYPEWQQAVTLQGVFQSYVELFGYPFDRAFEPVLPDNLRQPIMQLPFEPGKEWAFTGGPHGGWGDGSAWAALDFAPPGNELGCVLSNDWVVAVADGMIVRTGNGAVVQDLDLAAGQPGDGLEQTGWTVLYMHIETRDRIVPGTYAKAGDRIGHPSCEGGVSTGTHVHLARRYNGEWIAADQTLPFILDGWVSRGTGDVYDGFLEKNGRTIEAYAGRSDNNGIQR